MKQALISEQVNISLQFYNLRLDKKNIPDRRTIDQSKPLINIKGLLEGEQEYFLGILIGSKVIHI